MILSRIAVFLASAASVTAFSPILSQQKSHPNKLGVSRRHNADLVALYMANVGVFFGTSTGSTEDAAFLIAEQFGAGEPIDIDSISGTIAAEMAKYDALVVGTPTWNTGADTERSGTGWDEIYYGEMQDIDIAGKKVAVFGLGDSESYAENYADASGELHDVFEGLGCNMLGHTSQEGYEHEASKAIRGDKFCGLMLDAVNQEDLTPGRVSAWVAQLMEEGILEGGGAAAAPAVAPEVVGATSVASTRPQSTLDVDGATISLTELEEENLRLRRLLDNNSALLDENSRLLDQNIASSDNDSSDYVPYVNSETGTTMWISSNGRSCYYTEAPIKKVSYTP